MTDSVTNTFTQIYQAEVKAAYQRENAILRRTVRSRTMTGANRIYFPTLGKGEATSKARHADVVPMNLEHGRVYAEPEDFYAPEYIDDLDAAKTNQSLRTDYARASAAALGRATDNVIISALDTTSNTTSAAALDSDGGGALTLPVVTGLSQELTDRDVPPDMLRFAVINPATLSELLQVEGATSSDFTRQQLLTTGREPAYWMGFNWIVHTGLPAGVKGYFYHQPSVGLGIGKDLTSKTDWVPEKVAWLVNSWMSMGAVVIDDDGVIELTA